MQAAVLAYESGLVRPGGDDTTDESRSKARSDQITAPTLVLHGTADSLFPYPHGEALAEAIPGARLVAMDGVGHAELPPAVWNVVVSAIVSITSEEG